MAQALLGVRIFHHLWLTTVLFLYLFFFFTFQFSQHDHTFLDLSHIMLNKSKNNNLIVRSWIANCHRRHISNFFYRACQWKRDYKQLITYFQQILQIVHDRNTSWECIQYRIIPKLTFLVWLYRPILVSWSTPWISGRSYNTSFTVFIYLFFFWHQPSHKKVKKYTLQCTSFIVLILFWQQPSQ